MSMKNSNDTIGNRTCDLPICSAVPHILTVGNIVKGTKHYQSTFQSSNVYLKLLTFVVLTSSTYSQQVSRLFSLDHTQTHTAVGKTPLDEGSARHRDLYLTTQTLTWDKHPCPWWDSNPDRSKLSAADLRLRPHGHWDRRWLTSWNIFQVGSKVGPGIGW
jgi:hypothetical protein